MNCFIEEEISKTFWAFSMSQGRSSAEQRQWNCSERLDENYKNLEQVLRTLGEDTEQGTNRYASAIMDQLQLETFSN